MGKPRKEKPRTAERMWKYRLNMENKEKENERRERKWKEGKKMKGGKEGKIKY